MSADPSQDADFRLEAKAFLRALELSRDGQASAAAAELEAIDIAAVQDLTAVIEISALQSSLCAQLGRHLDVIRVAKNAVEVAAAAEGCPDDLTGLVAQIHAQWARACWELGRDGASVRLRARAALELCPGNELALRVLRLLASKRSQSAKMYRISVHGRWPADEFSAAPGDAYEQEFTVVAETPEHAFELAIAQSPDDLRAAMTLADFDIIAPAPREPLGICTISPFLFYASDDAGLEK